MTGMENRRDVVLVAGAINTDLVATMDQVPGAGETVTGRGFAVHGGGKAANQAVAISRARGHVAMVGAVGDDQFGADRVAALRADDVDVSWVQVLPDTASGVALILVEPSGENRIAYIPGSTGQIDPSWVMSAYEAIQPAVVLVPNELPPAALRDLLGRAADDGVVTILNATPEPTAVLDLIDRVSVLVVNEHEAAALVGRPVDGYAGAARSLGEVTGAAVIVTAGAEGAYLWDGATVQQVTAPTREVLDTTGAGDTFCGALATELAVGADMLAAVRFGVYAAGLSVTREGAQNSIPVRAEVQAALDEP